VPSVQTQEKLKILFGFYKRNLNSMETISNDSLFMTKNNDNGRSNLKSPAAKIFLEFSKNFGKKNFEDFTNCTIFNEKSELIRRISAKTNLTE